MSHLSTFFSKQSRKAWIAGIVATALTPIVQLLDTTTALSLRTIVYALLSGALAAVAVYATTDARNSADLPGEKAAVQTADTAAITAVARTGVDTSALQVISDEFTGQTVTGE